MPFIDPDNLPYSTPKEKIKEDPAKFGEAVYSFMQQKPEPIEVGELLEGVTEKYIEGLREACENGAKHYDSPFYIVVLTKKEPISNNNLRNWYVSRQTRPSPKILREDYPLAAHDVWKYSDASGDAQYLWTLPTAADSRNVLKNPGMYDPKLVDDIVRFNRGLLF